MLIHLDNILSLKNLKNLKYHILIVKIIKIKNLISIMLVSNTNLILIEPNKVSLKLSEIFPLLVPFAKPSTTKLSPTKQRNIKNQ
jgi:hypothetical protein